MDRKALKALKADGWVIGGVDELLGLSLEDMAFVEMKVSLAQTVKDLRQRKKVTQARLAELIESSQPRVAKIEKGEASFDLLVRALLALGATPKTIGRKMGDAAKAA